LSQLSCSDLKISRLSLPPDLLPGS
jgi:hypothetical protein